LRLTDSAPTGDDVTDSHHDHDHDEDGDLEVIDVEDAVRQILVDGGLTGDALEDTLDSMMDLVAAIIEQGVEEIDDDDEDEPDQEH
jgi:hypothetical protein